MTQITIPLVFIPLITAIITGLFRQKLGRTASHTLTIAGVFISFVLSLYVGFQIITGHVASENMNIFTWATGNELFPYAFHIGFLIDELTVCMLIVVTFVSLLVHIYSIGYMEEDDGYERFFSYISLFTFMMLMLVTGNNFLQLFFGWEGVGLVSYLLIGFWYKKESAISGSLKAFLVNRVGDFGFILGMGLIFTYVGSLDYADVFQYTQSLLTEKINLFGHAEWSVLTVACICLFIGAMGKSAQVPLHVWLPESMEGPTPISALIHAATMVTAGVFMVSRLSPLMEYSDVTRSFIITIGATGALFMGLLGVVMNDIKRVVAYSTLSQLGYMMVAMGASAYSAGMFHLITHACFKALLFLAAGSVIIGMHHEQDMRKMGGLYKKMPITYITTIIGSLALCAVPPFSGFFSKDMIIDAAALSTIPGARYAYYCVLIGAFFTALYTFRALFMTFHGEPRMDSKTYHHVHESPFVVTFPLIVLAIPSLILGGILLSPMLLMKSQGMLGSSVMVLPSHDVLSKIADEGVNAMTLMTHAPLTPAFWLTLMGILSAWIGYIWRPQLPTVLAMRFHWLYCLLLNKFGFDALNEKVIIPLTKGLGIGFYQVGDKKLIDGLIISGTSSSFVRIANLAKRLQTGNLNQYAGVMMLTVLAFLCWMVLG